MNALALLRHLHELHVTLTPSPNGRVYCRAPLGALTPALVDTMREHKDELHALVEAFEERVAIAQYVGGFVRAEAERLAWQCVLAPHEGCAACGITTEGDDHE